MSDFLKQFSKEEYENEPPIKEKEEALVEKKEVGKDTRSQAMKSPKTKIATTEHVTEKDETHHKRMLIRNGIIGAAILLLGIVAILIFRWSNQVSVADFSGKPLSEANVWALSNRITVESETVFDLSQPKGNVIEQNKKPNSSVQRGSTIRFKVSDGPNPEEVIQVPDFSEMTTAQVRTWINENHATNANINEVNDEKVANMRFIRVEFTNGEVDKENYRRKDSMVIFMSRGPQVFEKNITVPNFLTQTRSEVERWATDNGIRLKIEEVASSTVASNGVINQSISAGEKIAKNTEMSVQISLGPSILVPNFNTMSPEDAGSFPGLSVRVQKQYNLSVPFGQVISQSEEIGKELVGESPKITVVYSLGTPYIDNLVGSSESKLAEYFRQFALNGANITYQIVYVDAHEPRGEIVSMSHFAQFLGLDTHVVVNVSRGNLQPPAPSGASTPPEDSSKEEV